MTTITTTRVGDGHVHHIQPEFTAVPLMQAPNTSYRVGMWLRNAVVTNCVTFREMDN